MMGKLDTLMKASAGIAAESMGRPQGRPMNRSSAPPVAPAPDRLSGVVRSKAAAEIPVARIMPDPDQPREDFEPESLDRLAESLRTRGQLQPIRVRWDEGRGGYMIVCGERRWRAAERAGLATLSCVIMDSPVTPAELLTIQVVENALREDLRPIEQAKAFRALMDVNAWSTHQVARELAVDQSTVVKTLALLDLPAVVQAQVEQGALAPSAAYEVGKLDDPAEQAELAARVVSEGLSRADTVRAVAGRRTTSAKAKVKGRKLTTRAFRTTAGPRVTVEFGRGLTTALIRAALVDALATIDLENESDAA